MQLGFLKRKPVETDNVIDMSNVLVVGEKSLSDATAIVQHVISDPKGLSQEQQLIRETYQGSAIAGNSDATKKMKELCRAILDQYSIDVPGMTREQVSEEIYRYAWGLDILEDLYRDPTVDEIRVNNPSSVYVHRQGKNEKTDIKFKNEEHVLIIANRLIQHDRKMLTATSPQVESVRHDGTRITTVSPPFATHVGFTIRKHGTFKMTLENLINKGTLNKKLAQLLKLLVKGRCNILFSGGTNTGKTSQIRFWCKEHDHRLRTVTLETDCELHLAKEYPDRDIIELQEQADLGLDMRQAFRTVLRKSPDIIIIGEIRGRGEAEESLYACTRGHTGSMATVHTSSVEHAVKDIALMLIREGVNLPLHLAKLQVVQAFNIVVQMWADSVVVGVKKIVEVAEVWADGEEIKKNTLCFWETNGDNYLEGNWVFPNPIREQLIKRLRQYHVTNQDIREWVELDC